MTTQVVTNFTFEDCSIRVFGDSLKPLFVASDVCKALGIQNASQALQSLASFERSMLNIGRQGNTNVITESGLYTLILRCREAVKEGTLAYRFRVWVTNEVLPEIRKQGHYQCPALDRLETLTPAQQDAIRKKVAERALLSTANYKTSYKALRLRFQVSRFELIPRDKFIEALNFIRDVELKAPVVQETNACLFSYDPAMLTKEELRLLGHLVYMLDFAKPTYRQVYEGLHAMQSSMSPRFYSLMTETSFSATAMKRVLDRNRVNYRLPE